MTRSAVLLRGLVLMSPIVALTCTRLAADRTFLALDIAVVALAIVCAVVPDSHAGSIVVILAGINWWAAVDDWASPWLLAAALALTVFHVSTAAAAVAPPAARWTRAMSARWLRRTAVVSASTCIAWAAVGVIDEHRVPGNSVLLAAALIAVALSALWAWSGSVVRR